MRHFVKFGLLALFAFNQGFCAGTPENGGYAGLSLVGSLTPVEKFTPSTAQINMLNASLVTAPSSVGGPFAPMPLGSHGKIKSNFGWGLTGQLGYRNCGFRFEGELLFNYNNLGNILIDGYTFGKHYRTTQPTQVASGTSGQGTSITFPYSMSGHVQLIAGIVNVYYDVYRHDSEEVTWFPYIGAGMGFSRIQDRWVININSPTSNGLVYTPVIRMNTSVSKPVAQGIIGVGYQLDDYFSIYADFRYLTTAKLQFKNTQQNRLSFNTFTLGFNYWFNA